MSLENNRFEKAYQRIRQNKLKSVLVLLLILIVLENFAAWLYVAKRSLNDQPYVGLIERYFVLRPFRKAFPDQYTYPPELAPYFIGETSQPKVRRARFLADGLLGYRERPNTVTTDSMWTWRGTNDQGFIVTDRDNLRKVYQVPKPNDVFRVIVLGGSTVEGDGSLGSTTTLPAKLQDILRARYKSAKRLQSRIEVINAGVGGYFSTQELLFYVSELRRFQPDLVISYNGWNDLRIQNDALAEHGSALPQLWNRETDRNNRILNGYFEFWPTLGRAAVLMAQRSMEFFQGFALYHIPERAADQLMNGVPNVFESRPGQTESDVPFFTESVDRYINNMELLILLNRLDGIAFAWFLQPLVGLGNRPPTGSRELLYYKIYLKRIERRRKFYALAEQAQRNTVLKYRDGPVICANSLVHVFDKIPVGIYEDFGHIEEKGNAIVAERIAQELETCGVLVRRSGANK
jgi:hypothetical protein